MVKTDERNFLPGLVLVITIISTVVMVVLTEAGVAGVNVVAWVNLLAQLTIASVALVWSRIRFRHLPWNWVDTVVAVVAVAADATAVYCAISFWDWGWKL
jgi:hypothetical protein